MSLFSAINTAISGLSAQSTAFGNISENVSNSQTVGYKSVGTDFEDYLTTSTAITNTPGAVVAKPAYNNGVQGTITQTGNALNMAIGGNGFFTVSQPTGGTGATTTFNPQAFYTRTGDFSMNASGYLVNSSGNYLNGWSVNQTTGVANQNALAPIQVSQAPYNPVATKTVTVSANLPATPTAGTATAASPVSSQVTVYDSLGTAHNITLNWSQNASSDWTVQIGVPDSTTGSTDAGSADVQFGALSTNAVPEGTIGQVTASTTDPGTVTTAAYAAGQPATVSFTTNFGSGSQAIELNLGDFGSTSGVTQYAGSTYSPGGQTQDGAPAGSYTGVTTQSNGNVVVSYSNGQTSTIAEVPITTFQAPDALQSQNGQAYTATIDSGTPLTTTANTNGAGGIVTGSVEGSNVDVATEFSHLIVAQQSYSANAKVVTTANQMLQTTLTMIT